MDTIQNVLAEILEDLLPPDKFKKEYDMTIEKLKKEDKKIKSKHPHFWDSYRGSK